MIFCLKGSHKFPFFRRKKEEKGGLRHFLYLISTSTFHKEANSETKKPPPAKGARILEWFTRRTFLSLLFSQVLLFCFPASGVLVIFILNFCKNVECFSVSYGTISSLLAERVPKIRKRFSFGQIHCFQ